MSKIHDTVECTKNRIIYDTLTSVANSMTLCMCDQIWNDLRDSVTLSNVNSVTLLNVPNPG